MKRYGKSKSTLKNSNGLVAGLALMLMYFSSCSQQTTLGKNYSKIRGNEQQQNQTPRPTPNTANPAGPGGGDVVVKPAFQLPLIPSETRIDDDYQPFFNESSIIQQDLNQLQRERPELVPRTRYITFTFLDYLDLPDQQKIQLKSEIINSSAALLNSISTNNLISRPEPIDDRFTVFRIDINDFDIAVGEWNALTAGYPYRNSFNDQFNDVRNRIGNANDPIVRGDWFAFASMVPGRYANALELPNNINGLLNNAQLGLNIPLAQNIVRALEDGDGSRVSRVGLGANQSKKSANNRILERHDSNAGAFWISYDFAAENNNRRRNIVSSPIGPVGVVNDIEDTLAFDPDGFQSIFTLPNGLMGFFLANQNANRIDVANNQVVFNPNDPQNGNNIFLGYSCMKCHGGGKIIRAQDSLRGTFEQLEDLDLPDDVFDSTFALHKKQNELDQFFDRDATRLQNSFRNTMIISQVEGGNFAQTIGYYEGPVSFDRIASELNITPAQLDRAVNRFDNEALALQVISAKTSGIDRQTFEGIFDELLEELFELEQ